MKNTLILVVTHRGVSPETRQCIEALQCPSKLEITGNANICKARSIAFDQALQATEGTPIDTLLCIDDDMVFSPADAQRLVDLSRAARWPVSAVAVTKEGVLAARPVPPWILKLERDLGAPERRLWFTGLAFMAVPRGTLACAARDLDESEMPKLDGIRQWCMTGEHPGCPGQWMGEDFWFCSHFGGVELAPIGVGHLKWMPLVPDEKSIAAILGTGEN